MEAKHGTYAGYQQHRRSGVPVCEDCRRANAAYTKSHRAANPERHIETSRATNRALQRLKAAHRDEYERYYADELTLQRVVGAS